MSVWMPYAALGVVILFYVWLSSRKRALQRLLSYESHIDQFYGKVDALIQDSETPDSALLILRKLNQEINSPRLACAMLIMLLRNHRRKMNSGAESPARDIAATKQEILKFKARRPELYRAFGEACFHGFLASSFRLPIFGWFVRRLILLSPKIDAQRAEILAEDVASHIKPLRAAH